uniref:Uncharacterized protein n=1 Tax=Zea mays TaxID=4577 RepID=B4FJX0_MAIZE|nr:unknown [Zea mays]
MPLNLRNPHSSRNSTPPRTLPTLSCLHRCGVRWCSASCAACRSLLLYLEHRVAEPDPPELLLPWVLRYVANNLEQHLVRSCHCSRVILQQQQKKKKMNY